MENLNKTVCDRLKEARGDLTQEQFAELTGFSVGFISQLENGRKLTYKAAKVIGDCVGWIPEYLLCETDYQTENERFLHDVVGNYCKYEFSMETLFYKAAEMEGYTVEKTSGRNRKYILTKQGEAPIELTEWNVLQNFKIDVERYAVFRLQGIIEKKKLSEDKRPGGKVNWKITGGKENG